MKFEYELNYDFVNNVLEFKILTRPEFLRGYAQEKDEYTNTLKVNFETAQTIAKVLEKFAKWVESEYDNETIMTVAEIEEKLGVKNLKIVKEEQE